MTVTAAVTRACPVMAVLLICCLDISAGLGSAWLRFRCAPFLIFSVILDQSSPVSELNWHHTSVSSQDHSEHHSRCTRANGTGDPAASKIKSLHNFYPAQWSSPALEEQLMGCLGVGCDSLYIMSLGCPAYVDRCCPSAPIFASRGSEPHKIKPIKKKPHTAEYYFMSGNAQDKYVQM